jgi:hypothetical protein
VSNNNVCGVDVLVGRAILMTKSRHDIKFHLEKCASTL